MGIALGCIRLRYDDFCKMDFEEFAAVYNAYTDKRDTDFKDRWARMRILASIVIQPHLAKGKKITPEKLLPFPWEKSQKRSAKKDDEPKLTPEQQRARMAAIAKKLGDEMI